MVPPICNEWYVISCMIVQSITTGITSGFPSILTPVITSNVTDIHVTKEEASWFTAAAAISGPISYILLPCLMQVFGRRFTNISVNFIDLIGSITIALAPDYAGLLAGRAIQGIAFCQLVICSVMISEYSHPKRRGMYVTINFVFLHIGLILCHGLSIRLSWRKIAWFSTLPSSIGLLGTLMWPESPSWLAYKGRYQDCEDAFQWLRGDDHESRKELRELIMAQQELKKLEDSSTLVLNILNAFRSKEFLNPFFIIVTIHCFTQSAGGYYLYAYVVEIMTKLIGDKSQALYFTVGLDFTKLLAALVSTVIVSRFNRRILVFSGGSLSIFVLGFVCLFDYLKEIQLLIVPWLSAILLILYSFMLILTISILVVLKGEILPMQYKGIGTTASGVLASLTSAITMKLTSNMLSSLQLYGTFLVYLVIMAGCLSLLYFIIPETKDKTLQNIENEFVSLKLADKEKADVEMLKVSAETNNKIV